MVASRAVPKSITFTANASAVTGRSELDASMILQREMVRVCLNGLAHAKSTTTLELQLRERFGVNRRAARAAITEAEGMRSGVIEGAATRLVGAQERVQRLEARIKKAKSKANARKRARRSAIRKARRAGGREVQKLTDERSRHRQHNEIRGLKARLDDAKRVVTRDLELVAGSVQPSVVMGGKKLAKARHACVTPNQEISWRTEWKAARNEQWFIPGERDRASGNNEATLILDPSNGKCAQDEHGRKVKVKDRLVLNTPASVLAATGIPRVELELEGLAYARATLRAALAPDPEQLQRRVEAFEAERPARTGGKRAKKKPTALSARSPLTVRVFVKDGQLKVALTILRLDALPIISSIHDGAVGVDVNPDHLAVCRNDRHGNPVLFKRFNIRTTGTSGQRSASIHRAVTAASKIALADKEKGWTSVPIVCERLNFGYARLNLRYLPAKLARKLTSFAYSQVLNLLAVRAQNLGLELISVHPADTSRLGQTNYQAPYGVSTDLAAACCIARRGKGHSERVRPSVLKQAPVDACKTTRGRAGATRPSSVRHLQLPKRSETQECPWLARKASATPVNSSSKSRMMKTGSASVQEALVPSRDQPANREQSRADTTRQPLKRGQSAITALTNFK